MTEYEALFGAETVAAITNGPPLNIGEKDALAKHVAARILKMPTPILAQVHARLTSDGANKWADILHEEISLRAMKGNN